MIAVPSLQELGERPDRAMALPADTILALLAQNAARMAEHAAVQNALTSAMLAAQCSKPAPAPRRATLREPEAPKQQGPTLSIEESCRLLHKPRRWLFRNSKRLPFVRRMTRKHLVCDEAGLRQWLVAHIDRESA